MSASTIIALVQLFLTVVGGAVAYGQMIAEVREIRDTLKGENGVVQRLEALERKEAARTALEEKSFPATAGR